MGTCRLLARLFVVLVAAPALSGCAAIGRTDDFSVSGDYVQRVSAKTVQTVVIRCHCLNRVVTQTPGLDDIQLRISGTHSSVGYHGPQIKPDAIDTELLRFVERRADGTLVLESQEYTYIHHAFIIDSLQVFAPADRVLRIEPLDDGELEGRDV